MNINDVATQISTTSRLITRVALSTCDTRKWLSLEKWVGRGPVTASDQHNSSPNYQTSDAVSQHNCEMGTGISHLRQAQRRLSTERIADMCQKYRSGATVHELAREFNMNRGTVSVHLKASGVTLRLQPPSEESIVEMVKLYQSGLSCAIIGAKLRLSPQTVLRRLKERGVELRGAHEPRPSLSYIAAIPSS